MLLRDKVIVVTGGTGVLGYSFNKAIVAAGGKVCILGRDGAKAEARAAEIEEAGGEAIGLSADVLSEVDLERAAAAIVERFGRIDGLVNGAGGNQTKAVVQPEDDLFHLDMEALQSVMQLNLFGSLLPTQVFGRKMMEGVGPASIVNISSLAAQTVITKVLGYSLAKAAIDNYTKWFAVEAAKRYGGRLRMNAIMPGFFLTEQNKTLLTNEDGSLTDRGGKVVAGTPFGRFGKPEELCAGLVYLLSDTASFVTGTVLEVDGGFKAFSGV